MSDVFYQTQAWRQLRYRCLRRDRWRCTCCGVSVRVKGSSRVDHVVPRRERPDLALSLGNVRTLCTSCDNKRHSEKGGHQVQRPDIDVSGYPTGWRMLASGT